MILTKIYMCVEALVVWFERVLIIYLWWHNVELDEYSNVNIIWQCFCLFITLVFELTGEGKFVSGKNNESIKRSVYVLGYWMGVCICACANEREEPDYNVGKSMNLAIILKVAMANAKSFIPP